MTSMKEQYEAAKKAKGTEKVVTTLFRFVNKGDQLIGTYVDKESVVDEEGKHRFFMYIFDTDAGRVKAILGRGFESSAGRDVKAGKKYCITYKEDVKTGKGRPMHDYDVETW